MTLNPIKQLVRCDKQIAVAIVPSQWTIKVYLRRPQRSCGQGNVFTGVCDSVHRGGVSASVHVGIPDPPQEQTPLQEQTPPGSRHTLHPGADPPSRNPPGADTPQNRHPPGLSATHRDQVHLPRGRLRHTVNERPVRILLECILVFYGLNRNSSENQNRKNWYI